MKDFNVFAGCETGLLKGIKAQEQTWDNISGIKASGRTLQVMDICWFGPGQEELLLGRKNNSIEVWNSNSLSLVSERPFPNDFGHLRSIGYTDSCFLTATDQGCVRFWNDGEEKGRVDAGPNLWRMRQNVSSRHILLTGGKETPLRLWDLNRPEAPSFIAKNVRHNWLELRVPVWMTDAQFMSGSSRVVTCTGHKQIRVYDPTTSQRRPVIQVEFGDNPFTAVAVQPGDQQVVAADTHGWLGVFDLRRRALLRALPPAAGSVRALHVHPSLPLLVSAGLDRYVRVHHLEGGSLLHKTFVKSAINCLAVRDAWIPPSKEDQSEAAESCQKVLSDDEEAEDKLWSQMEVVGRKRVAAESCEVPALQRKRGRRKRKQKKAAA